MKRTLVAASFAAFALAIVGCSKPEKSTAEIDVEAAQAHYDEWTTKRIDQIQSDPNLSDALKKKQIEEIKASAKGQMNQVQGLAEGQADQRERGR
ncbi:MAG: hypothetical protein AB8B50_03560 [Pirellulaceae bacterium]